MTTHGHFCILVLRPWIDYHCMIRMVKHETLSQLLYTSRLKTSCRNSYGETQYMFEQPQEMSFFSGAMSNKSIHESLGRWIFLDNDLSTKTWIIRVSA